MAKNVWMYTNLEPDLAKEVEALAEKLGLPMSRLVSILIRQELKRLEREDNEEVFFELRRIIRGTR